MRWHYEIRDLASLPRARGIKDPPCMAGPWWLRRIRRAAAGRDCCWHHDVNWHLVSETAIGIALQAQASGMSPEDTLDALDLAACGLAGYDGTGLILLLGPGAGIEDPVKPVQRSNWGLGGLSALAGRTRGYWHGQ